MGEHLGPESPKKKKSWESGNKWAGSGRDIVLSVKKVEKQQHNKIRKGTPRTTLQTANEFWRNLLSKQRGKRRRDWRVQL